MEPEIRMFRLDGHWLIQIEAEQWVIDDILHDVEATGTEVFVSISPDNYVRGGTTEVIHVYPSYRKPTIISASVKFDPFDKLES